MNLPITKRQKDMLSVLYNYIKDTGYPPTFEEMRPLIGVSSNQSIVDLLRQLERKGFIKKEEGTARGIKILDKGLQVLGTKPLVPYVGITAGGPFSFAFEDIEWRKAGGVDFLEGILVKVKGDSMNEAGINDGDVILVKESKEFKNGDIVLARNDDETTVKRFIHDNGRVYLKPENSKYQNIPIYPDTRLIGKVVRVVGKN